MQRQADNRVGVKGEEGAVEEVERLGANVACPTLLVYGKESWASNPQEDGRARHFRNARVVMVEKAWHWVHHDQLDAFLDTVREFLAGHS